MSSINDMKLGQNSSPQNTLILITIILLTAVSFSSTKPITSTTTAVGQQSPTTINYDNSLGKRGDGDTCYAKCKTVERLCYEGIGKENEGAGMQEMVICMQSTDSCKINCDEMLSVKRNVIGEQKKQSSSINDV